MTISKYCKNKGMDLQEFRTFKNNITATASAIIALIKQNYNIDNGIYHDISEILQHNSDTDIKNFIIQELKNKGVEFYDNNKLWRL